MSAKRMNKLKPKSKVWFELGGEPVFGDGKARLLRCIEKTGSLTEAAEALGMSYRGLWGRLGQMERRLGVKLVARKAGGRGGGGSQLTPTGRKLVEQYEQFRKGINAVVDKRFEKIFSR